LTDTDKQNSTGKYTNNKKKQTMQNKTSLALLPLMTLGQETRQAYSTINAPNPTRAKCL